MAEPIIRPATTSEKLGNINYGDVVRSVLHGFLLGSPGGPVGSLISGLGAGAETAFPGAGTQDIQMGMIPTSKNIKEFLSKLSVNLANITAKGSLPLPNSATVSNLGKSGSRLNEIDPRAVATAYMATRYPNRTNLPSKYTYYEPGSSNSLLVSPGIFPPQAEYTPEYNEVRLGGNYSGYFKPGSDEPLPINEAPISGVVRTLAHETQHARQNQQLKLKNVPNPELEEPPAYQAGRTAETGWNNFNYLLAKLFPESMNSSGIDISGVLKGFNKSK